MYVLMYALIHTCVRIAVSRICKQTNKHIHIHPFICAYIYISIPVEVKGKLTAYPCCTSSRLKKKSTVESIKICVCLYMYIYSHFRIHVFLFVSNSFLAYDPFDDLFSHLIQKRILLTHRHRQVCWYWTFYEQKEETKDEQW